VRASYRRARLSALAGGGAFGGIACDFVGSEAAWSLANAARNGSSGGLHSTAVTGLTVRRQGGDNPRRHLGGLQHPSSGLHNNVSLFLKVLHLLDPRRDGIGVAVD
jgi:hypothetical protein